MPGFVLGYSLGNESLASEFNKLPKIAIVPNTTGAIYTTSRMLGSTSTFALSAVSVSNSNLSVNSTGTISAASPIGHGNTQIAYIRESNSSGMAVEYPVTLSLTPTAPDAPTIVVSSLGNGTIKLAWADGNSNGMPITARKLWRATSSGNETLIGQITLDSDGTYTDTGLINNVTYYYTASTVNALGESPKSIEISANPITFSFSITSDVFPLSKAAVSPTVNINDPIYVDLNGTGIQITSGGVGVPDASKVSVTVARSGFDINKNPVTYHDTLNGLGILRGPYPSHGSPMLLSTGSYIVVLSDQIYSSDTITNVTLNAGYLSLSAAVSTNTVTRNDTMTYPNPITGILNPPYERISNAGLRIEIAAGHRMARSGQQIAAIDVWVEDSLGHPGPVTTINTMSRSQYTPASGYVVPQDTPAAIFGGTVYATGISDGAGRVHYLAYPFCGPVYSSKTGLQNATWPTPVQPTDGWTVAIDNAGNHAEIYAWVNQDGTVGASAAVQTVSVDPGTSSSYGTVAAAAAAIKAYNNAHRSHNDLSGGVIMLRDVSGSTAGTNAGSYSTRGVAFNSLTTYNPGLTPLKIRGASLASSQLCRWRGQQSDGTVISLTNKTVASRVRWEYIYFDSVNLTGTDHVAIYGGSGGLSTTQPTEAAHVSQIFIGCIERGSISQSYAMRYGMGLQFDYKTDSLDPCAASAVNAYNITNGYFGMITAIGCKFVRSTISSQAFNIRLFLGGYVNNLCMSTAQLYNTSAVLLRGQMWGFFEIHGTQMTSSLIQINNKASYPVLDLWLGQFLLSGTGRIASDGSDTKTDNVIIHHGAVAGVLDAFYSDQGYWSVRKSGIMKFCSVYSINNKRDTSAATTTAISNNDGTWSALRQYYLGEVIYDGSSIYYEAILDVPAGTLLTNTVYWYAIPNGATAYGAQPRRTGSTKYACGVGNSGNAFTGTVQNDTTAGPTSWYGEFNWRDTAYNATISYILDTSPTGTPSTTNDGNYTPTGAAQMNKVRSGEAVLPFDLRGNARRNDGSGACGCIERAS